MDSRVPSVRSLCNDMFEPLLCGGVTLEVISRAGQKGKIRLFAVPPYACRVRAPTSAFLAMYGFSVYCQGGFAYGF